MLDRLKALAINLAGCSVCVDHVPLA